MSPGEVGWRASSWCCRGGDQPETPEQEKKGDCRGLAGSQPWKTLNARDKASDEMKAEQQRWPEGPWPWQELRGTGNRGWETIQTPARLLTVLGCCSTWARFDKIESNAVLILRVDKRTKGDTQCVAQCFLPPKSSMNVT